VPAENGHSENFRKINLLNQSAENGRDCLTISVLLMIKLSGTIQANGSTCSEYLQLYMRMYSSFNISQYDPLSLYSF